MVACTKSTSKQLFSARSKRIVLESSGIMIRDKIQELYLLLPCRPINTIVIKMKIWLRKSWHDSIWNSNHEARSCPSPCLSHPCRGIGWCEWHPSNICILSDPIQSLFWDIILLYFIIKYLWFLAHAWHIDLQHFSRTSSSTTVSWCDLVWSHGILQHPWKHDLNTLLEYIAWMMGWDWISSSINNKQALSRGCIMRWCNFKRKKKCFEDKKWYHDPYSSRQKHKSIRLRVGITLYSIKMI